MFPPTTPTVSICVSSCKRDTGCDPGVRKAIALAPGEPSLNSLGEQPAKRAAPGRQQAFRRYRSSSPSGDAAKVIAHHNGGRGGLPTLPGAAAPLCLTRPEGSLAIESSRYTNQAPCAF